MQWWYIMIKAPLACIARSKCGQICPKWEHAGKHVCCYKMIEGLCVETHERNRSVVFWQSAWRETLASQERTFHTRIRMDCCFLSLGRTTVVCPHRVSAAFVGRLRFSHSQLLNQNEEREVMVFKGAVTLSLHNSWFLLKFLFSSVICSSFHSRWLWCHLSPCGGICRTCIF